MPAPQDIHSCSYMCARMECVKAQRAKSNFVFCLPCGHQHDRDAIKAACAVRKHIRSGAIKRAAEHICTDCGKQATEYDHRDYLKPVDVQPVCRSCNHLRGPAFNSVYRPSSEAA